MSLIRKIRSSLSMNLIGGLVFLLLLFGVIIYFIGNRCIVGAIKKEYTTATCHMADSAAVLVNGDHLDDYLAGEKLEEYAVVKHRLDIACDKLNVSLIYVIKVDTSDYGRFVSIFNPVNNSVDDSSYTEWELGYRRNTTNEEYMRKYRAIYEQEAAYETVFRLHPTDGQHPHITTMVPVKDSSGNVAAILCMQRPVNEMANAVRPYILHILGGVVLLVIAVSALAVKFLRGSVIKPVEKVSAEATRFANEHTKGEPIGKLSNFDVIVDLAGSIDSMETDMVEYVRNLTAVTAEKERMGAELSIAAMIQLDALPDDFPAFPDRHEFDIYASMDPAKEIGGDFYNFFFLDDDDHLALIMADVAGNGIPAALFMMLTNIIISERTQMGGTPAEILAHVNDSICEHNRADMFVTVWLGILEISTGHMIAANAGHEKPAIYRKNGSFELVENKHGFVIGGLENVTYKDYEMHLNKGDKLFLYTDGLPEATDIHDRMYTVDRMIDTLNEHKNESPQQILEAMTASVDAFVGEADQFDDLTMLCLEMKDDGSTDA